MHRAAATRTCGQRCSSTWARRTVTARRRRGASPALAAYLACAPRLREPVPWCRCKRRGRRACWLGPGRPHHSSAGSGAWTVFTALLTAMCPQATMTASPACRAWLTQHHASVVLHPSRAVHAPVMVLHTATRAVQLRRPGSAGGRGAGAHRGGRAAAAAGGAAGAGGQPGAEAGGRGRLHGPRAGRRGGRRRRGPRRRGALPGRDGRHARGGGRAAHAGARPRARPFPAACRAGPAPRAVPGVAAPGVAVTYLAVPALAACAPGAPRRPGPRCGRRGAPCYCPHAPCMWAAQAAGAACAGTTAAQAQVCGACRVRACCSDRALWCGRRRGGRGRRGPRRPQAPARPGRRLAATTRPAGPRARAARRHACSRTAAAR